MSDFPKSLPLRRFYAAASGRWSLAGLVAFAAVGLGLFIRPRLPDPVWPGSERIRAVTFDVVNRPPASSIKELRGIGISHVAVVPFAFQRGPNDENLSFRPDARWYTESERGIRELARQTDSLGIRLIIKPHVWIGHYGADGQTRAEIGFDDEGAWRRWEEAYLEFMLFHAALAESVRADILVVGTELRRSAIEREGFWRRLISETQTVFAGRLTYAANWYEEYSEIRFWDALDYIGVQAYFPIAKAPGDVSRDRLLDGWAPHGAQLRRTAEAFGRPVLFTEIGYRSVPYAASEPWRWSFGNEKTLADPGLQARLYEAFFSALWDEPWFGGAIMWKWRPEPSRRHDIDYSPRGKPAEQVLRTWFTGSAELLPDATREKR